VDVRCETLDRAVANPADTGEIVDRSKWATRRSVCDDSRSE